MTLRRTSLRDRIALALLGLALALRVLVPSGWMPAEGNGFAITICSGTGAEIAWLDAEGNLHKQKPASDAGSDHGCAFAGMGAPMLGSDAPAAGVPPVRAYAVAARIMPVSIGHGLAAPPPPATGPPALV